MPWHQYRISKFEERLGYYWLRLITLPIAFVVVVGFWLGVAFAIFYQVRLILRHLMSVFG